MLANFKARGLAIFWVVFVAIAWGVIVWTIAEGPINSLDIILTLVATLGAYLSAVFGYSWIRGRDFFQEASSSKIRDMLENPRNNEWDEINELVKEYRNERDH